MYSLYRAWFGGGESYPRLETLSPPDTVVRVGNEGEYHFVAHRAVLAAHSGYLKALLATATADDSPTPSSSHDGTHPVITSVTVPSTIGGETFAPLLNYMYTGRLEVSLDNIYTVLLATHLLHMPGALEQCRAALMRLRAPPVVPASASPPPPPLPPQQHQQQPSSILRPVPNRLLGPAFCWPQSSATAGHLYPARHLELPPLPALQLSPAIAVLPTPTIHNTNLSYGHRSKEPSVSPSSNSSQQQLGGKRSTSASPELVVTSSSSSSVVTQRSDEQQPVLRCHSPSASSERVSVSDGSVEHQRQQQQSTRRRRTSQQRSQSSRSGRVSSQRERSSSSSVVVSSAIQTPGVVYDVACCDGPVRFHRVLNENYSPTGAQTSVIQQQEPQQQQQQRNHEQQQLQPHLRVLVPQCNGRSSEFREIEEDSMESRENDENELQRSQRQPSPGTGSSGENHPGSYTCAYCHHTFKSQYCYRKHARRHLLPTDGENAAARQLLQQPQQQQQQQQPPQGPQIEIKKREVRLLDLNVQYYPCKICGRKFPSYYFVHKHRKLCHANVEEPQGRDAIGSEERMTIKGPAQQQQLQLQQQQPSTSENAQKPT